MSTTTTTLPPNVPANGAITIYSGTDTTTGYQPRPAPLISVTKTPIVNNIGFFGSQYNITLTGYTVQKDAIGQLTQQTTLRNKFSGINKLEVSPEGNQAAVTFDEIRLESISFEEGTYVNYSRYTVNLIANKCSTDAIVPTGVIGGYSSVSGLDTIKDLTDSWSFEVDESFGMHNSDNDLYPRAYIVTRNVSAVGKDLMRTSGTPPWENAYTVVTGILQNSPSGFLPSSVLLSTGFSGYNHSRTSSIDKSAGSVSVTDTWYVASGNTVENYTLSVSSTADNPYVKVNIEGTIKGLTKSNDEWNASGYFNGDMTKRPYKKAYDKFMLLSNDGNYGINSKIYKRANNAVSEDLNSQPLTVSLGQNEIAGEITYNLEFDNRPTNYFEDALYESISVTDTYPGDVFATIPVLGRPTGPILQYTFGRTEFKRDISIEIILDSTDLGYQLSTNTRSKMLLTKPSLNDSTRGKLNDLITELSPSQEPGIRKYFLSPPQETWNPKEGRYTLGLSWTYELDQ